MFLDNRIAFSGNDACRANNHKIPFEVGLAYKGLNTLSQLLERVLRDTLQILSGFKITSGEQADQISDLASFEFMCKGNTEYIGIIGYVDVFLLLHDPFDLIERIGLGELSIIANDLLVIRRPLHEMAEVVDHFPDLVAAIFIIGGDFRHGEICLRKHNALRVDADKNVRYLINSQCLRKFCYPEVNAFDGHQLHEGLVDLRLLPINAVDMAVVVCELPSMSFLKNKTFIPSAQKVS